LRARPSRQAGARPDAPQRARSGCSPGAPSMPGAGHGRAGPEAACAAARPHPRTRATRQAGQAPALAVKWPRQRTCRPYQRAHSVPYIRRHSSYALSGPATPSASPSSLPASSSCTQVRRCCSDCGATGQKHLRHPGCQQVNVPLRVVNRQAGTGSRPNPASARTQPRLAAALARSTSIQVTGEQPGQARAGARRRLVQHNPHPPPLCTGRARALCRWPGRAGPR